MSTGVERVLIVAAAAFALMAVARWRDPSPAAAAAASAIPARRPVHVVSDSALEEAENLVVTNDPFRLSNAPPDARFDPGGEASPALHAVALPVVRPVLVLKAIVGGPPWQAVVDGIPGQPPGTVARQGIQFDKLVVRAVTKDSVIIQGPDTSWILRFGKQP